MEAWVGEIDKRGVRCNLNGTITEGELAEIAEDLEYEKGLQWVV